MRFLLVCSLAACSSRSTVHPDAAAVDAAIDGPGAFTCNTSTCDQHTQYCYQVLAGAAPSTGCNALPANCSSSPTCSCVVSAIPAGTCGGALVCEDRTGDIYLTCMLP